MWHNYSPNIVDSILKIYFKKIIAIKLCLKSLIDHKNIQLPTLIRQSDIFFYLDLQKP